MKYRKKPVVIDAIQFKGWEQPHTDAVANVWPLAFGDAYKDWRRAGQFLVIPTLEGDHLACPGDYIIRGVKGEFYPCKPDIFKATYERVRHV